MTKKAFGVAIPVLATVIGAAIVGGAIIGSVGTAHAADYADRPRPRVDVVVDELFLRAGGCPRNPNCIAPRVLPISGRSARGEGLVSITVPAPPPVPSAFSFFGIQ